MIISNKYLERIEKGIPSHLGVSLKVRRDHHGKREGQQSLFALFGKGKAFACSIWSRW